jgi:hypothetical protein
MYMILPVALSFSCLINSFCCLSEVYRWSKSWNRWSNSSILGDDNDKSIKTKSSMISELSRLNLVGPSLGGEKNGRPNLATIGPVNTSPNPFPAQKEAIFWKNRKICNQKKQNEFLCQKKDLKSIFWDFFGLKILKFMGRLGPAFF